MGTKNKRNGGRPCGAATAQESAGTAKAGSVPAAKRAESAAAREKRDAAAAFARKLPEEAPEALTDWAKSALWDELGGDITTNP